MFEAEIQQETRVIQDLLYRNGEKIRDMYKEAIKMTGSTDVMALLLVFDGSPGIFWFRREEFLKGMEVEGIPFIITHDMRAALVNPAPVDKIWVIAAGRIGCHHLLVGIEMLGGDKVRNTPALDLKSLN